MRPSVITVCTCTHRRSSLHAVVSISSHTHTHTNMHARVIIERQVLKLAFVAGYIMVLLVKHAPLVMKFDSKVRYKVINMGGI